MLPTVLKRLRQSLVFALLLSSPFAHGQENELTRFFAGFTTLKADLEQTTYDQNGRLLQEQTGHVVIQRPGQFLWVYQSPYEQTIVADGQKIWLYDIDLEQVIIKTQDSALGNTPVSLLMDGDGLAEHFDVEFSMERSGLTWYSLVPKQKDGSFERLSLGFGEGRLRSMEVQDSFGQLSEFLFNNMILDEKIDPATFQFELPDDVDVMDETTAQ